MRHLEVLRNTPKILWIVVLAACLISAPLAAEEPRPAERPAAQMNVAATRIEWLPLMDYERLALTVAGPKDFYIRQEFEAGQPPAFGVFDSSGNPLPDGMYTYELWITPRQKAEGGSGASLRQSGYLAIRGGRFVVFETPTPANPPAPLPSKRITAEEIFTEGVCIGNVCSSGDEGFPLRLKDDPLILTFDDPAGICCTTHHDWSLQANDFFTGSGEYFAIVDEETGNIPFRVEGDAPDASLYIRSNGNVGLGTSTPSNNLHVKVATAGNGLLIDGDQSTDVAVNLRAHGNSAGVLLNDLQGGANQRIVQQLLDSDALRIRGLNDALSAETVPGIVLSLANGNVGINCQSAPGADLVVDDGGACNAGTRSEINAGATQFTVPSSRSLKENFAPVEVEGILQRIRQVKVYSYDFINGPKDRIGLIAEDFHAIFGRGSEKTISGDEIQLAMWLAIQELSARNDELLRKVEELSQKP